MPAQFLGTAATHDGGETTPCPGAVVATEHTLRPTPHVPSHP